MPNGMKDIKKIMFDKCVKCEKKKIKNKYKWCIPCLRDHRREKKIFKTPQFLPDE